MCVCVYIYIYMYIFIHTRIITFCLISHAVLYKVRVAAGISEMACTEPSCAMILCFISCYIYNIYKNIKSYTRMCMHTLYMYIHIRMCHEFKVYFLIFSFSAIALFLRCTHSYMCMCVRICVHTTHIRTHKVTHKYFDVYMRVCIYG